MTPLPCPCGRGMRAVLRDHAGNPVRLADRCKTCSGEAIRAADASPPPFMPAPSEPRPCRLCSPELGPCRAHAGREEPAPPPRTLPVTPAERACATVLRTWLEWHETPPEPRGDAYEAMLNLGDWLADSGIVEGESLALTPAGAALLARVEADRSAEDIARELVVKLQTSGAPGLVVSDAQSLLADVRREVARQARLAGTTPIDAPPAKEPR